VKALFSVIASPSRLEVLQILNTKGPMTYSELKTQAGFKAKKESGKFAYHLRKLLRQNLIAQNRAERKYMLTQLGRLVLNSSKEIEKQALMESGRLFVRSSEHKMEEFTTDRIVHSLVTEAGMPVELAQRVASEAESRIYKFQTAYLTAPLIRELVNSILIEEGLEEYRHRLSRLGMPVYDVTEIFEKIGQSPYGVNHLVNQTACSVLSEYLLQIQLPRDITDSHLSGDINISNVGYWSLKPDTAFVDLSADSKNLKNAEGKFPFLPRLDHQDQDQLGKLLAINHLLCEETGRDIYYAGFSDYFTNIEAQDFRRIFSYLAYSYSSTNERPHTMFEVDAKAQKSKLSSILSGYSLYAKSTPIPSIGLALRNPDSLTKENYELLYEILRNNGLLSFNKDGEKRRSSFGVVDDGLIKAGSISLDSVSLNMPRIALEAMNDEVYYRTRVRLQLENAVNALRIRRKLIDSNIKRGLLPAFNMLENMVYGESVSLKVNLTGLAESLSLVKPNGSLDELFELQSETITSAYEYFTSLSDAQDTNFSLIMTSDESSIRFLQLDRDKFGRSKIKGLVSDKYPQGINLKANDLSDKHRLAYVNNTMKLVKGGVLTRLTLELNERESVIHILNTATSALDFCVLSPVIRVCKKCGKKQYKDGAVRCESCGWPTVLVNNIEGQG
jgi:DNA-binding transcriptional ArsR family regulator